MMNSIAHAAKNNDCIEIKKLVSMGYNVNTTGFLGLDNPPLLYAIEAQHHEAVKTLLQLGAEPNKVGYWGILGKDALTTALKLGHTQIISELLHYGAGKDPFDRERIAFKTLLNAIEHNDAYSLQLLENDFNFDIENIRVGSSHDSLLHLAAQKGHAEVLEKLIHSGVSVDVKNDQKTTPLHIGALNNHVEVTEILLENGARINLQDLSGQTAIFKAAQNENFGIVKLLLNQGAVVDFQTQDGKTLLHLAVLNGNAGLTEELLEHNTAINSQDQLGQSAMHIAAIQGNLGIVELLYLNLGMVDLKDAYGKTPLHYACLNNHAPMIQDFVSKYDANLQVKDNDGNTPLHLAAQHGHIESVHTLLKLGAQSTLVNQDEQTPSDLALQNHHLEIFAQLEAPSQKIESPVDLPPPGSESILIAEKSSVLPSVTPHLNQPHLPPQNPKVDSKNIEQLTSAEILDSSLDHSSTLDFKHTTTSAPQLLYEPKADTVELIQVNDLELF